MSRFVSSVELDARLYCQSFGLDPDAKVWGYESYATSSKRVRKVRWLWYLGARRP